MESAKTTRRTAGQFRGRPPGRSRIVGTRGLGPARSTSGARPNFHGVDCLLCAGPYLGTPQPVDAGQVILRSQSAPGLLINIMEELEEYRLKLLDYLSNQPDD